MQYACHYFFFLERPNITVFFVLFFYHGLVVGEEGRGGGPARGPTEGGRLNTGNISI